MKNMKISKRLTIGFGAVVLLVAILAAFSISMTLYIDAEYTHLVDYPFLRMQAIAQVECDFLEARRELSHMSVFSGLPGAASNIQAQADKIDYLVANAMKNLDIYARLIDTDPAYTDNEKNTRIAVVNDIRNLANEYGTEVVAPIMQANIDGRRDDVVILTDNMEYVSESLYIAIAELKDVAVNLAHDISSQTSAQTVSSIIALAVISGLAIAASIVLAVIIERSVVHSIKGSIHKMEEITHAVARSSSELSNASHAIADSANNQAASIEETSATMNQTASMIKLTKENTQHAARLSAESEKNTMNSLKNVERLMEVMNRLNESSAQIAKIADAINSLASQTNILALNASVEAVRVGEAGKGFAVVAEEVRKLATKSAEAANNTTDIIKENIMLSMQGVENSKTVSSSLSQIHGEVRQVNMLLAEISTASEEQSRGVDQIAAAVANMEHATQTSAAAAEESSGAADELHAMAQNLELIEERLEAII